MESQFKQSNNNVLILVILGAIIFFVFIMPMLDKANASEESKLKEHLNNTNTEPTVKLDKNMCSKQCCKFSQWPVPTDLIEKTIPEDQLKNYIGSNMSCNFGNGSGCLCVTKDDFNYLANHGGNSNSSMCAQ